MRSASRKRRAPGWLPKQTSNLRLARQVNSWFLEGRALQDKGHFDEALAFYRKVAFELERANVKDPSIYAAIGHVLIFTGDNKASLDWSKRALEIDPEYIKALINAAAACRQMNRVDEAHVFAQKAYGIEPGNPQVLASLAVILLNKGLISQALVRAAYAIRMMPESLDAIGAIASAYGRIGDVDTALPYFDKYQQRLPFDPNLSSTRLFCLHYKPGITAEELKQAHKEWGGRFGAKFRSEWPRHENEPVVNRKLRIGYVSGDFRHHVVGYWTKHIVTGHNRDRFEVFCFANNAEDEYSKHFKKGADHWISILDRSDEDAARVITDAKIDILIDLSGHTGAHRLLMMARKPAPVQATWCGYIDSTGLEAFDYVIADEVIAPSSEPSPFVEEPLRLPHAAVGFEPITDAPAIGPVPALRKGYVTFGCFNNPAKIGDEVLPVWAEILNRVPHSKLLVGYGNLDDAITKERLLGLCRKHGISEERLQLRRGKRNAILQAYSDEIDVALDTFPYNGGTTTCEALWMGVPVVALYGGHPMSRFGCSLLAHNGLPALATTSKEEYVERAVYLAGDRETLSRLRKELRGHLTNTPLFNSKLFIEGLENAYLRIFERWCQKRQAGE